LPARPGDLDDGDYPAYTTGRAAEVLGVRQASLRSLDAAGAVSPERSDGGRRRYTRQQLAFASAALRNGLADIALLCLDTNDLTGLRTADLTVEAPIGLIPRGHPLASRQVVTVAELAHDANFTPECPPLGLDEIVDRVALGRLVTVVGSGAVERISPEVTAVPVSDLPAARPPRPGMARSAASGRYCFHALGPRNRGAARSQGARRRRCPRSRVLRLPGTRCREIATVGSSGFA
jgi:MerR HTH family regulatory protein